MSRKVYKKKKDKEYEKIINKSYEKNSDEYVYFIGKKMKDMKIIIIMDNTKQKKNIDQKE